TLSNRLAAKAGVADRAVFYERDIYETDLSPASVVTIYLLPEVNLMMRPKLFAMLKPGTRAVSHDSGMGAGPPDLRPTLDAQRARRRCRASGPMERRPHRGVGAAPFPVAAADACSAATAVSRGSACSCQCLGCA